MRRSLRTTAVALAAASFLALLDVLRTILTAILEGHPLAGIEVAHRVMWTWLTLMLVSPWCAFMAGRFPLRAGHILRTLAAHAAGSAVFVALHLVVLLTLHALHTSGGVTPSAARLLHTYAFYIALEMSVYAGIVVVLLLLDARREATERAVASARLAQNLATARLENLQAQIRPHFLFNTLNAIAVLARKGDGAAVDRAIGDLGELLRASFDPAGRHEIALGDELGFLERYVELQRLRFPDRLEVAWNIDEETRVARVPALLVQPLVENAIEHGLATSQGGHVMVAVRRDRDTLEIEVDDDGPGFGDTRREDRTGIGLANTRERLALLYGERGTLSCDDRPGGGGRVRIRLPWRVGETAGAGA